MSSNPDVFRQVPLNINKMVIKGEIPDCCPFREWESPTAGLTYVLEGPDPFALTMPPAPAAGSAEFAAEIAEVYQMALCRDWEIAAFMDKSLVSGLTKHDGSKISNACKNRLLTAQGKVADVANRITSMRWFSGERDNRDTGNEEFHSRRRFGKQQTEQNLFRGEGEDPWDTPFLSQFMIMGLQVLEEFPKTGLTV